jgi:hypothetical protein
MNKISIITASLLTATALMLITPATFADANSDAAATNQTMDNNADQSMDNNAKKNTDTHTNADMNNDSGS